MFNIRQIHHVSLIVENTQQALVFYQGVLGLTVNHYRPDLGYPGAWLDIGAQQIHLLELPNPDPRENRPAHGGRDRHLAVNVDNLDELVSQLEKYGIAYSLSRSGRRALFCRDPDGNALEIIEQEQ